MKLEFKVFERSSATLEDLGTVKDNAGKKGSISFIPSNFSDETKRVALVIERADGQSAVVACSAKVSKALRAKELNIKQLAGLSILGDEDGRMFIAMPGIEGGGLKKISLDSVKVEAVEAVATEWNPEAHVAF